MRLELIKVGGGMIVGRVLSLLLMLLYSYSLELEEFGLLSALIGMSVVFSTMLMIVPQNFIVNSAAVLNSKKEYRSLRRLAFISVATFFTVLFALFFPALLYASQLGVSKIPVSFILFSTAGVATLLIIVSHLRPLYGAAVAQMIEQIVRPVLAVVIFITLLMFNYEFSGYMSHVLSFVGASIVGLYFLYRFFNKNKGEGQSESLTKSVAKMAPLAAPVYFLAVSRIGVGEAGTLGAFYWVDAEAAGIYRFYAQLTLMVSFPLFVINYYFAPKIAVLVDGGEYRSVRKIMTQSTVFGGGAAFFALIFIFLVVNLSVFKYYYPEFYGRNSLLASMGSAVFVTVLSGPAGLVLIALRKSSQAALIVLLAGGVNVLLMWFFSFKGLGVDGVGAAYVVSMLILSCAQGYLARHYLRRLG